MWGTQLWHRLTWGLALTPLVFAVFVSVDLATAFAVALTFAPELVAIVLVGAGLFLLSRRIVKALRTVSERRQVPGPGPQRPRPSD